MTLNDGPCLFNVFPAAEESWRELFSPPWLRVVFIVCIAELSHPSFFYLDLNIPSPTYHTTTIMSASGMAILIFEPATMVLVLTL